MQQFPKEQCMHRLIAREPIGSVYPGEIFKIESEAAFGKSFTSKKDFEDFMNGPDKARLNHPCTGPILVEGANNNMSLVISIRDITIYNAMQCLSSSTGILKGEFEGRNCHTHGIETNGNILLGKSIELTHQRSIGVLSTLDNEDRSPGRCSANGGNFDIPLARPGRRIYLPVNYDKAIFAMGDLHFRQGLGEILGMGFEASGNVEMSIELADKIPFPIIDGKGATAIIGWGNCTQEAAKSAVNNALDYLQTLPAFLGWLRSNIYQVLGGIDLVYGNISGKVPTCAVVIRKNVLIDPISRQTIFIPPRIIQRENNPKEENYHDIFLKSIKNYTSLALLHSGDSREIRAIPEKKGIVISKFNPKIYSHIDNGAIEAEGTDKLRLELNKYLCDYLHSYGISTSTLFTEGNYLLMKRESVPNIEVVVKGIFTGSPKHTFEGIMDSTTRDGTKLSLGNLHIAPYVRFDWRGKDNDKNMPDGLADNFINTYTARETALEAFALLKKLFNTHDLDLVDCCFFMNEKGDTICGEVSPDNLGITYTGDNESYIEIFNNRNKSNTLKKWQLIKILLIG